MKYSVWILSILYIGSTLMIVEAVLRLTGFGVWDSKPDPIVVNPGGSVFQINNTTGFSHIPGKYEVIINDHSFTMTHDSNGLRITNNQEGIQSTEKLPEIWIFGGSFTHGWAVNDDESFPWLLQSRFGNYKVVNYGVGGFGTLLSLLQLENELANGLKPDLVIFAYLYFHDQRNIFSRERRKVIVGINHLGPLSQPKAILNKNNTLSYGGMNNITYTGLPGIKYSAIINLFDNFYNRLERIWLRETDVTFAIFKKAAEIAEKENFKFVVAGLSPDDNTQEMLKRLETLGLDTFDISHEFWEPEFNNLPWDSHPNALGQRMYGQALIDKLLESQLIMAPSP